MIKKTSLLILCFTASGFLLGPVFAQDTSAVKTSDSPVPETFFSETSYNSIELGGGYISDDAYRFGRYNGMKDEGAFAIGDIKIRDFSEDGDFWEVRGTNLGLESRYLHLEGGSQGRYKVFLEYDKLPNYQNDSLQTPFYGVRSNNLTLPSDFDIDTNLYSNLHDLKIETKRERIGTGISFIPRKRWQFDVDFSHENKKGTTLTGAPVVKVQRQIIGTSTTSLLPEPVDYDTDIMNAKLQYAGADGQISLNYHMSLFNNNDDDLSWQDPFNPSDFATMSLDPDNEFHQVSLSGVYTTLPYNSRITALVSMGRMTQDQDFLPYTNPGVAPSLPRNSLDAEVWTTNAQLKLTSRPINKLTLNAELRYNERDNDTSVDEYIYEGDRHNLYTITNDPYSYKNNRVNLEANYRFNSISSLRGGYKFNQMKRDYTATDDQDTNENTLYAKWKIKAHSTVDLAFFAETAKRDGQGDSFQPDIVQNPEMRQFFVANRDRNKYGTSIDYMATEKLFLSARAEYNKDDYDDTEIGLTEETQPVYTLDFSYQPHKNLTFYGYYTYENFKSKQSGSDVSVYTPTTDWDADFKDTFNTFGIGGKLTELGKWDIGTDIVYSKSRGDIDMKDLFNPGTEEQYPDTKTDRISVKLWADYKYSKNIIYKFGYWFEDYDADNWAVDDVQPYNDAKAENILFPGGDTQDYHVNVFTVSMKYQF